MTHIVTCCWEEGEIWVSFPKQRLWKLKPGQHIKVHLTKTSDERLQLQDNHTYIQTPRRELMWWGNTLADIKTQVESSSRWKKTGHQGKNVISLTISLYWGFFNNDFIFLSNLYSCMQSILIISMSPTTFLQCPKGPSTYLPHSFMSTSSSSTTSFCIHSEKIQCCQIR